MKSSSTNEQTLHKSSLVDLDIGLHSVEDREASVVWDGVDCGPLAGNP